MSGLRLSVSNSDSLSESPTGLTPLQEHRVQVGAAGPELFQQGIASVHAMQPLQMLHHALHILRDHIVQAQVVVVAALLGSVFSSCVTSCEPSGQPTKCLLVAHKTRCPAPGLS